VARSMARRAIAHGPSLRPGRWADSFRADDLPDFAASRPRSFSDSPRRVRAASRPEGRSGWWMTPATPSRCPRRLTASPRSFRPPPSSSSPSGRRRPGRAHHLVRLSAGPPPRCAISGWHQFPTSRPFSPFTRSRHPLQFRQNAAAAAQLRRLGIGALRLNTDALSDVGRVRAPAGTPDGPSAWGGFGHRRVRHRARGCDASRERGAAEGAPPGLGTATDDHRPEFPERAGGARRRQKPLRGPPQDRRYGEHRGGGGERSDLILTTTDGPAAFTTRPEWQVVRAVRERRFLRVTGSEFNRPSPRAPRRFESWPREFGAPRRERPTRRAAVLMSPCVWSSG